MFWNQIGLSSNLILQFGKLATPVSKTQNFVLSSETGEHFYKELNYSTCSALNMLSDANKYD
jgi:hypothetical protein